MGNPCATDRNYGSATPMTMTVTARQRHVPMSDPPPRPVSNACAAAHWRNNASAPNTPSHTARSTAFGPA